MTKDEDKAKLISKIAQSVARLWTTRDELSFKKIRFSHLTYFLPLVLILTLLDQRNTYFTMQNSTFMGSYTTILVYAAYCIGSLFVLLLGMKKLIGGLRGFCALAVIGLVCWLVLQDSNVKIVSMMVFQFGLGGCAIYATYAYVFVLRNAERLFGIFLVAFNYGLFIFLQQNGINNTFISKILPALLVALLAICIFRLRKDEFPDTSPAVSIAPPKGLYIVLACPFALFSINVFGEAIVNSSGGSADMRGIGAMVAVLLALVIQFVFRRNVWHMLNLFLIFTITGIILLALPLTSGWLTLGDFLFGIGDGFGYIMVFYITGLIKKYKNGALFWNITMATVMGLVLSILATDVVQRFFPSAMPIVAVILAAFFLFLFLLFSPVFQRNVFGTDWMDDYLKLDMMPADEKLLELRIENKPLTDSLFNDFITRVKTLTPTERQIFQHYKNGKTPQEILDIMFITMGTLKAHNTKIYTKLNVTSRDALLLYIELIQKSGLHFN